jgi:hypothetical protein
VLLVCVKVPEDDVLFVVSSYSTFSHVLSARNLITMYEGDFANLQVTPLGENLASALWEAENTFQREGAFKFWLSVNKVLQPVLVIAGDVRKVPARELHDRIDDAVAAGLSILSKSKAFRPTPTSGPIVVADGTAVKDVTAKYEMIRPEVLHEGKHRVPCFFVVNSTLVPALPLPTDVDI